MIKLEIACNSFQSCLHAQEGGANRIELFENLGDGGCTPSYGMIKKALEKINIPIYVMIRPRGGDFCYNDHEFDIMQEDVMMCKTLQVEGIVYGILQQDGRVDKERCRILQSLWGNGPITFHRAIDRSEDIMGSCKDIVDMGFERILSSGGQKNVDQGKEALKNMQKAYGQHIIIMPGAGITPGNVKQIVDDCQVQEVHATAKNTVSSLNGTKNEVFSDKVDLSDVDIIRSLRTCLM